eukprot:gene3524-4024_t
MAFTPQQPGSTDRQSRQSILQELQQQKQQLLQQGSPTPGVATAGVAGLQRSAPRTSVASDAPRSHSDAPHTGGSMSRRSALEYASAHSNGYFVAVDSQFGNHIIPAIPRLDDS